MKEGDWKRKITFGCYWENNLTLQMLWKNFWDPLRSSYHTLRRCWFSCSWLSMNTCTHSHSYICRKRMYGQTYLGNNIVLCALEDLEVKVVNLCLNFKSAKERKIWYLTVKYLPDSSQQNDAVSKWRYRRYHSLEWVEDNVGMSLRMAWLCQVELKAVVGQWDQRELSLRKQTTQGTGGSWHSGSEAK